MSRLAPDSKEEHCAGMGIRDALRLFVLNAPLGHRLSGGLSGFPTSLDPLVLLSADRDVTADGITCLQAAAVVKAIPGYRLHALPALFALFSSSCITRGMGGPSTVLITAELFPTQRQRPAGPLGAGICPFCMISKLTSRYC